VRSRMATPVAAPAAAAQVPAYLRQS
jgi:hypothetical protein